MSATPPEDPNQPPPYPGPQDGLGGYPVHPGTPSGEVGGPPPAQVPQPQSIRTAVLLMRLGAVISLISLVLGFATLDSMKEQVREQLLETDPTVTESTIDTAITVSIGFMVVFGALGILLWLWMAWKNGEGRSWARVVATVFGALNLVSTLYAISMGNASTVSAIFTGVNVVLAIVILVLLWRKESSQFYAARSAPRFG